jgi:hypothetical protein
MKILKSLTLTIGFIALNVELSRSAPRSTAALPQPSLAAIDSLPSGKYKCFSFANGTNYVVGAFGSFSLDGKGNYTNKAFKTAGRYAYDAQQEKIVFSGGKFDGYSAQVATNATTGKPKLIFKDKDPDGTSDRVFTQYCSI